MHEVTPRVVAIAVRIEIAIWITVFHVSFFILYLLSVYFNVIRNYFNVIRKIYISFYQVIRKFYINTC